MNQTYKDTLAANFPNFFRKASSYPNVGNGWYELIVELCTTIQNSNPPADFEVAICNKQFGGLRVYANNATTEINILIHQAEDRSYEICESCGKAGELIKGGRWWQTLCGECRRKRK